MVIVPVRDFITLSEKSDNVSWESWKRNKRAICITNFQPFHVLHVFHSQVVYVHAKEVRHQNPIIDIYDYGYRFEKEVERGEPPNPLIPVSYNALANQPRYTNRFRGGSNLYDKKLLFTEGGVYVQPVS